MGKEGNICCCGFGLIHGDFSCRSCCVGLAVHGEASDGFWWVFFGVQRGDCHSRSCHFCAAVQGAAIANFLCCFVVIIAIPIPSLVMSVRRCKGQLTPIFDRAVLAADLVITISGQDFLSPLSPCYL